MKAAETNAAACDSCRTVFVFNSRDDVFSGETFCPICVNRIESKKTYKKCAAAKKANKGYRVLR